jgi:molybdopterin converting factor small subunit
MPHVVTTHGDCIAFTGGVTEFDVAATSVRQLILELERRYPGLGDFVERRMAIAIDGEIHQDAYGTALAEDTEVYLIPKIGGG